MLERRMDLTTQMGRRKRDKIFMLSPLFNKIDPFMGDTTFANPLFVGDSTDGKDVKDILIGFTS
jgi:hypothetical protein